MNKNIIITGIVVLSAMSLFVWFSSPKHTCSAAAPCTASAQEIKQMLDTNNSIVLLDVRRPDEYSQGHIKNSQLLSVEALNDNVEPEIPDKSTPIIVYCRTGRRSAEAYKILKEKGYTNVTDMEGGINAWITAGYKVEK